MGQTKDLNVGRGGIGAFLNMILKKNMHRHATHKRTQIKLTATDLFHSLDRLANSQTRVMKFVMIGFALVNPGGIGLLPLLSFSNNVGLTCTLLRALWSSQQIKDNVYVIHAVGFIPVC